MFRLEDCSMVWPSGRGVHSVSLELARSSHEAFDADVFGPDERAVG